MAKSVLRGVSRLKRVVTLFALTIGVGGLFSYALKFQPTLKFIPKINSLSGDSATADTSKPKELKYPLKPKDKDYKNNIDFKDPENVKETYQYNLETKRYEVYRTVGEKSVFTGKSYSLTEYLKLTEKKQKENYYKERSQADDNVGGFGKRGNKRPSLLDAPKALDKLFGGGIIDIQYSGMAEMNLGASWNTVRNPQLPDQQQSPPGQLVFEPKIQMNVRGSVGKYINMGINYNTDATFEFENQTKLNFQGKEDDIIKSVELGNVSLPLNGSLIQGGNALFGVKTSLQFGRLKTSLIFTQSRGQTTETEVSGGAQVTEFDIQADNYDQNRHYFLGHTFRDNYNNALNNLPVISSPYFINYIEVWVTNTQNAAQNTRDIISFMDLGESEPYNTGLSNGTATNAPISNTNNTIGTTIINNAAVRNSSTTVATMNSAYPDLAEGLDWTVLGNARLLSAADFTYHPTLGYISLNSALNNVEILAVAYEYTVNGRVYKVGEFSREFGSDTAQGSNSRPAMLFTKMLKGTTIRTRLPIWDLMMKNIYSLGTYNLSLKDFKLNIVYADDPSGADLNYLPVNNVPGVSGLPLLTVLSLDKINRQQEAKPDGVFDMIDRVTINQQKAQVIFPVLEPFGQNLSAKLNNADLTEKYVYQSLYDSTKWLAQQDVSKNKFFLRGNYTGSSSSEIMIGAFNIPEGAVTVTSNGLRLTENVDFIVDYNIGKVTIINQGILSSGSTIKVSAENNSLFNLQQKTLLGGRFDYTVNKNLLFGSTLMHMYERPLTPKTNIGDEPILNTIIGFDGSYTTDSRFLTKMVDKIPFIETKAKSTFLLQGEYAKLIAHEPKSIQKDGNDNERGVSLVDDFEASETQYDLRSMQNWRYASIPQKQPDLFPEWSSVADRTTWNNFNSRLSFYSLDPVFFRSDKNTPAHLTIEDKSNHYSRQVFIDEVYPNRNIQQGTPNIIPTLDLAFHPQLRGSYNFNSNSSDLKADGTFIDPSKTWGGVMRRIETNDFQAANIAYLEFWMMDPFIYNQNNDGELYFNLGEISEDQLPDRRKSFENGLAADGNNAGKVDETELANVPIITTLNNFFDNDGNSRENQDLGIDGMTDGQERTFWDTAYLDKIESNFGANSVFYQDASNDPCNDNFKYYNDPSYSTTQTKIVDRYERHNGQQGNSNNNKLDDGTAMSATLVPDDEDINQDFTMNQVEDYFQYKVDLEPAKMNVGENFITDVVTETVKLQSGAEELVSWYQFKIPITEYQRKVGNIDDFKSIRFMRMFLKGFDTTVICRFAAMQLVRTDWRIYENSLKAPGPVIPVDPNDRTTVLVNTVNVENNSNRKPVPYVLPPSLKREIDPTQPGAVQQNEQSLSVITCGLQPDDARGVFRTTNYDMRNYKNLQMFIHAEGENINDNDLTAFIRFGTDLQGNYYEYEIPLKITPAGSGLPIEVWPEANNLNLDFRQLFLAKQDRLAEGKPLNKPFERLDATTGAKVTLVGLPDLSNVRVMMLGIRNKSGETICPEVWFNELRLSGHNNQGGWAAVGRMQAKLADFGTVNLTGSASTIGFGGIQQKLNDRNLDETWQYDVSSNFELGKFFPQSAGVTIPMFIGYTETFITPKYNPFNPDVELKPLYSALNGAQEDSVRNLTQTYQSRYSINFTNVSKRKTSDKPSLPWDISNFNVSYAFSRAFNRSPQIEEHLMEDYRASIGYRYSPKAKPWKPFDKLIKGRKLPILKQAQIDYLPQSINIRLDANRQYSELLNRSNDLFQSITPKLYDKNFTLDRFYNLNWKLMPSLNVDYTATTNARIQEPIGALNTEEKRDTVRQELYDFGRMTRFNQQANITYNVPFSKIKPLNWISSNLRYSSTFSWDQAPPNLQEVGNTIGNSADKSINGNLNLIKLYNKIPALRNINRGIPPSPKKKKKEEEKKKGEAKEQDKDKDKKKELNGFHKLLRGIMMIRNVNVAYTLRDANSLPGFNRSIDYLGNNFLRNAPGLAYTFGSQDENFRFNMADNGHLSQSEQITNFYQVSNTRNLNVRSTIEPIKNFRINLTFEQTNSNNKQGLFRYDTFEYRDLSSSQTGTFSSTYIFLRTAFEKQGSSEDGYKSQAFEDFLNNRFTISQRLQNQDTRVKGTGTDTIGNYPRGYGKNSQSMYYINFLNSYAGNDANTANLSPFIKFPLPSWNINYNGLSKLEGIKDIFSNISLTHSYTGRYTVGGYNGVDALYSVDTFAPGQSFDPDIQISAISISERFSPLIGVNFSTKSGFTGRINYNRSRLITFVPRSYQINENQRKEFVLSAGYRVTGLLLPFKSNGRKIFLPNDFNFNVDVSIMNNLSIIRNIEQNNALPNSGQRMVSIKPNIQYKINDALNINFYYNRQVTEPQVQNSFPTALTSLGTRIQYIFN